MIPDTVHGFSFFDPEVRWPGTRQAPGYPDAYFTWRFCSGPGGPCHHRYHVVGCVGPDRPIPLRFGPGNQSLVIFVHDGRSVPGLHGGEILVTGLCVDVADKGVPKPTLFPRLKSGSFFNFRAQVIESAHRFPLNFKDPGQYRPRAAPARL